MLSRKIPSVSALALACAFLLSSCGGEDVSLPINVSGRVVDGYIEGAIVCLDTSNNGKCDSGEISAQTGTDGGFTLTGVPANMLDTTQLVAEVPDSAKDADDAGKTLKEMGKPGFSLATPKGYAASGAIISPISSLVAQEVNAGQSLENAKKIVASALKADNGVTVDPNDLLGDFIASKATTLGKVAQTTALLIGEAQKQNATINLDDALKVVRTTLASIKDKATSPSEGILLGKDQITITISSETLPITSDVSGWAARYPDPQNAGAMLPPTGGEGAPSTNIYTVTNRAQLIDALANKKSPTYATSPANAAKEPKIVYIKGTIYGTDLGNGQFSDEAYYVKTGGSSCGKWNFDLYLKSFDSAYVANLTTQKAAGNTAAKDELDLIKAQGSARTSCANVQKNQIKFGIPSNTTVLGVGTDAKIVDGYFELNAPTNIIIRNIEFEAPQDRFMAWTPSDGATGNWNARYKAIQVVTGTRLWFDHLTLSDGAHPDSEEPIVFGKHIQRHDGLIDVEDGTDYVTVSYSVFKNHNKTFMIGSGDGKADKDRGKNHITFFGNLFENAQERSPRVRFGQVHIYNNYFRGSVDNKNYPLISRTLGGPAYFIGMGIEAMILSERNAFQYEGQGADEGIIVDNFKGYQFVDNGSFFNSKTLDPAVINQNAKAKYDKTKADHIATQTAANKAIEDWATHEYTNDIGWKPPYTYTAAATDQGIRAHVLKNAGSGKITIVAP